MTRGARRDRSRAAFGIALLLSIALASPVLAGWQEDYKAGRAALNEGKHNKAETLLRSAIAERGAEKANAIKASGMFFEPYLPHFYLGMTLFQKQEYAEAAREFDLSESQGVIRKDAALMAQLTQMRATAKNLAQTAAPPPPAPAPTSTVAEAKPQAPEGGAGTGAPGGTTVKPEPGKPADTPGSSAAKPPTTGTQPGRAEPLPSTPKPPASTGPDPALTRAIDAAATDVAAAQKLAAESGDLLEATEKSQLTAAASAVLKAGTPAEAQSSHEKLRTLRADLGRKVDQRRRERDQQAALEVARRETRGLLQEAEKFAADNRADLKPSERGQLTQEIASVRGADSADAMRAAAKRLGTDVATLRKSLQQRAAQAAQPPKPPAGPDPAVAAARREYAAGVEAYFGGDYDRAITALVKAGDAIQDDPAVHAMLGSALYKRYLLTRPEDDSLKARAEEAFRTAVGIRPGYTLDAKYYPPKVIAFFKQVASRPSGPSGQ